MALPKLKDIKWVTTDCYGTLIDWEKGITDAFKKEAENDGFSFDEGPFLDRFMEVQAEIMAGSYELYAEVLRRAAVKVAGEIGWEIEPSRAQFLPDSVAYWLPFREANAAMDRSRKRYDVGIVSNIDDKLLGISRRHLRTELDLVVTAQQVRSYKPDPAHFKECARRIGGKKGWLHIGERLLHRRRAAAEDERAGDLGQPPRREARGAQAAHGRGQEPPRRGEEARRRELGAPWPRATIRRIRRWSRALTSASRRRGLEGSERSAPTRPCPISS